jgi:excinuclease UvrABC ATPase subunit
MSYFDVYDDLTSPQVLAKRVLRELDPILEAEIPIIGDLILILGHYSASIVERYCKERIAILKNYIVLLPEIKKVIEEDLSEDIIEYHLRCEALSVKIALLAQEIKSKDKEFNKYFLQVKYEGYDEIGIDPLTVEKRDISEAEAKALRTQLHSFYSEGIKLKDPKTSVKNMIANKKQTIEKDIHSTEKYLIKFRSFVPRLQNFYDNKFRQWMANGSSYDFATKELDNSEKSRAG